MDLFSNLMLNWSTGYVNDEEATTTMLDSDGWLRTGDLCYFDDQGFLFYVDRLKELIKCNGYQVEYLSVYAFHKLIALA